MMSSIPENLNWLRRSCPNMPNDFEETTIVIIFRFEQHHQCISKMELTYGLYSTAIIFGKLCLHVTYIRIDSLSVKLPNCHHISEMIVATSPVSTSISMLLESSFNSKRTELCFSGKSYMQYWYYHSTYNVTEDWRVRNPPLWTSTECHVPLLEPMAPFAGVSCVSPYSDIPGPS